MHFTITKGRERCASPPLQLYLALFLLLDLVPAALSYTTNPMFAKHASRKLSPPRLGPPTKRDNAKPLKITNLCDAPLWPGIGTQAGTGPGTGGFELAAGKSRSLKVSPDWQGRIWGRTNCSFNVGGTGASNLNGHDGSGAACATGDCGGVLSCVLTGATPVTLAEFALEGGISNQQTFYDISLVDGYNLPMAITYIPGDDKVLKKIPPNLTNCACIATPGWLADPAESGTNGNATNATMPLPLEPDQTSEKLARWCPWDLQLKPPTKPGDGVYPYPDDKIQRPIFDPCLSACARTNSPSDCCTGKYNDPKVCKPGLYSKSAKAVCPDAYSFAYDDHTSTFIIPTGGGWEVTFCPTGRSTNILRKFKAEVGELGSGGTGSLSKATMDAVSNVTFINSPAESSAGERTNRLGGASLCALIMVLAWAVVL